MTETDAINKLIEYCNDQIKNSGFWIYNKKKLLFDRTVLFEPWERVANLKLPDQLCFSKDDNYFVIDSNGIKIEQNYKWSNIAATAIKTALRQDDDAYPRNDKYLLVCLNNGLILEKELGNIDKYHGQVGHFIEQYKLEFKKNLNK